ncbi:MAG: ComEC/Rec2 family competence protein [Clostridia bacterium]|nr:ComEC/Rec2 family competence protein [Clostridia bacterium]
MDINMKRPMLFTAIAVIFISIFSLKIDETGLIIAIGLIFIAYAVLFYKSVYQIAVIAFCILLFLNSVITTKEKIDNMDRYSNTPAYFDLLAIENTQSNNRMNFVVVKIIGSNKFADNEKLLLSYYGDRKISAGEKFTARVRMMSLKNSVYKDSRYADGIYAQLNMEEYCKKLGKDKFWSNLQTFRDYITKTITNSMTKDSAATMCGITIGNKDFFGDEFASNVKSSGVSHVMVVSGLHLSIILGGIFSLIEKLIYNKYLKLFSSLISVIVLVAVCGFTMSVIRAGIMFILAALAPVLNRDNDSLSCLSTSVVIISLFSPFATYSVSLQLSVLATFGIIAIAPFYNEMICDKLNIKNKIINTIISMFINTLSATVTTLPITILTFGFTSIVAPATNIFITYPVTYALTMNCVAILFNGIPLLTYISKVLFLFVDIIVSFINGCINYFGELKFAAVNVSKHYAFLAVVISMVLLIIMYTCKKHNFLIKSKLIKERRKN